MLVVGTTEAAEILNISTARMRALLVSGRVQGAYKTGKLWLVPLVDGKPVISKRKRGPEPRWQSSQEPVETIINVNSQIIKKNLNENDG